MFLVIGIGNKQYLGCGFRREHHNCANSILAIKIFGKSAVFSLEKVGLWQSIHLHNVPICPFFIFRAV